MAFNPKPKVNLRYIDVYEYESVNETGNKVNIDMYDGEKKSHQSPTELLLSAVASCSAVDVAEILKKRRKTFESFEVEAAGERREEHPRIFQKITLTFKVESDNIKEEEIEKHAKTVIEKYCSVASTVSGVANIEIKASVSKS